MVVLPPRLLAVAAFIPPGARVADIGTDHGRLPVYLVQQGLASFALGTDLRPEPLEKARRLISRCGLEGAVSLRQSDGLAGLPMDSLDIVVVAGLGADTIIDIWQKNPPPPHVTCLLQPMSHAERLRAFLGASINAERLAREGRRLYCIIAAAAVPVPVPVPVATRRDGAVAAISPGMRPSPGRRYVSRALENSGDPLLPHYLAAQIARLEAELSGLRASRRKADQARRAEAAEALAFLRHILVGTKCKEEHTVEEAPL
ncbi:MAG: class I SAM-dependent methyltransferase [Oscillospiraceae bacterium]|nr:class I SAM-dependent methyltransferase [Oscillospiraceae bacterium]